MYLFWVIVCLDREGEVVLGGRGRDVGGRMERGGKEVVGLMRVDAVLCSKVKVLKGPWGCRMGELTKGLVGCLFIYQCLFPRMIILIGTRMGAGNVHPRARFCERCMYVRRAWLVGELTVCRNGAAASRNDAI